MCAHVGMMLSAGAASLMCAETLRQENYGGRIIMVSRDDLLPYDKTRLSKVSHKTCEILFIIMFNKTKKILKCNNSYNLSYIFKNLDIHSDYFLKMYYNTIFLQ